MTITELKMTKLILFTPKYYYLLLLTRYSFEEFLRERNKEG